MWATWYGQVWLLEYWCAWIFWSVSCIHCVCTGWNSKTSSTKAKDMHTNPSTSKQQLIKKIFERRIQTESLPSKCNAKLKRREWMIDFDKTKRLKIPFKSVLVECSLSLRLIWQIFCLQKPKEASQKQKHHYCTVIVKITRLDIK